MRKSLKLLFVAAATFAGAYGLSQPAQALEQSEHIAIQAQKFQPP